MGSWGEVKVAASARDIFVNIAEGVVNRLRPEPRIGKVFEVNASTGQATVLFAGEVYPDVTYVRCGANMIPSISMIDTYETLGVDAPGDIVRVAGSPGRYYIDGFISGRPRTIVGQEAGLPIGPTDGQFYYDQSRDEVMYWNEAAGIAIPAVGDTGWIPLAPLYSGGWTDLGGIYQVGQYKRLNGWTVLRGLLLPPASPNVTMFILPPGFRPEGTGVQLFNANSNTPSGAATAGTAHTHGLGSITLRIQINPTTGAVSPGVVGMFGHYSISGIQFPAEQ